MRSGVAQGPETAHRLTLSAGFHMVRESEENPGFWETVTIMQLSFSLAPHSAIRAVRGRFGAGNAGMLMPLAGNCLMDDS